MSATAPKMQHVHVYLRVRPFNEREKGIRSIEPTGIKEIVSKSHHGKTYTFDRVFNMSSKQCEIFAHICDPMINEVLMGYNCTIFAYGQTGSGKTYTMEGVINETNTMNVDCGIILRAAASLFSQLHLACLDHSVRVSYMELYNEEIFDLMTDDNQSLRIFEDPIQKGSIMITDLKEIIVHNLAEVTDVLKKGSEKRHKAETLMNQKSSRSHAVFTVTVRMREANNEGDDVMKIGKINFVDLAGSENIGRSGATNMRKREAGNINQSLLTLGRVIKALTEKRSHIPYRESKLTRILQDSLGGKTKTRIIATVSPSIEDVEETTSTLEYACAARKITNKPEVNKSLNKHALLNHYTNEIDRLRRDLMAARSGYGVTLDEENYNQLITELDVQKQKLTDQITKIRGLEGHISEVQIAKQAVENEFLLCRSSLQQTESELAKSTQEKQKIMNYYMERGNILTKQADNLLKVANESTSNEAKLQDKLKSTYEKVEKTRTEITESIEKHQNDVQLYAQNVDVINSNNLELTVSIMEDLEQKLLQNTALTEKIDEESCYFSNLKTNVVQELKLMFAQSRQTLLEAIESSKCAMLEINKTNDEKIAVFQKCVEDKLISMQQLTKATTEAMHEYVNDTSQTLELLQQSNEKCATGAITLTNNHQAKCEQELQMIEDIVNQSLNEIHSKHNLCQKLDDDMADNIKEASRYAQKLAELNKEMIKKHLEETKLIQGHKKSLQSTSSALESIIGEYSIHLQAKKTENQNIMFESFDNISANLGENTQILSTGTNMYTNRYENVDNVLQSVEATINTFLEGTGNKLMADLKNIDTTSSDAIINMGHFTSENANNIITTSKNHLSGLKMHSQQDESYLKSLDEQLQIKNSAEKSFMVDINNLLSRVDEILKEGASAVDLPKPTGNTPAKTTNVYPKTLASMKSTNLEDISFDNNFSIIEDAENDFNLSNVSH